MEPHGELTGHSSLELTKRWWVLDWDMVVLYIYISGGMTEGAGA